MPFDSASRMAQVHPSPGLRPSLLSWQPVRHSCLSHPNCCFCGCQHHLGYLRDIPVTAWLMGRVLFPTGCNTD
jgi:hypothetical protein